MGTVSLQEAKLRCATLLRKHITLVKELREKVLLKSDDDSPSADSNNRTLDLFDDSQESSASVDNGDKDVNEARRFATLHAAIDPINPLLLAYRFWRKKLGPAALLVTDAKQRKELAHIAKLLAALLILSAEYLPALLCLVYCVRLLPSDVRCRLLTVKWACHLNQWRLASELLRLRKLADAQSLSSPIDHHFDALNLHCRLHLDDDVVKDNIIADLVEKNRNADVLERSIDSYQLQALFKLATHDAVKLPNQIIEKVGDPMEHLEAALKRYRTLVRSRFPELQGENDVVIDVEAGRADLDRFLLVASDVAGLMETLWRCAVEFLNVGLPRETEAYALEGGRLARRLGVLSWMIRYANLTVQLKTAVSDADKLDSAASIVGAFLVDSESQLVLNQPINAIEEPTAAKRKAPTRAMSESTAIKTTRSGRSSRSSQAKLRAASETTDEGLPETSNTSTTFTSLLPRAVAKVRALPDHQEKCPCYSCTLSAESSTFAMEATCARTGLVSAVDGISAIAFCWDRLVTAKTAYLENLTESVDTMCSLLGIRHCFEADLPSCLVTNCAWPLMGWSTYSASIGDWSNCRLWAERGLKLAQRQALASRCEFLTLSQLARESRTPTPPLGETFDWIVGSAPNSDASRLAEEFLSLSVSLDVDRAPPSGRRTKKATTTNKSVKVDCEAAMEEFHAYKHLFYKDWRRRLGALLAASSADRWEAALFWSETMATAVRQRTRITVASNDVHFPDVDHFKSVCAKFPRDFTIVLLTVDERRVLWMVRLTGGTTSSIPLIVPLINVSQPIEENSRRTVFESLTAILTDNNESMKLSDPKQFWETRRKTDKKLQALLETIQKKWIGCFAPLLLSEKLPPTGSVGRSPKTATKALSVAGYTAESSHLLELAVSQLSETQWGELARRLAALDGVSSSGVSKARMAWARMRSESLGTDFAKSPGSVESSSTMSLAPTVLVLSSELAVIPWECLPVFDSQPVVCRCPSLQLLARALHKTTTVPRSVDGRSAYYLLDPGRDLDATKKRFVEFFGKQKNWSGLVGLTPSAAEVKTALESNDIFLYCGHGSGGRYFGSTAVRQSDCKAVALLMGCSSARIHEEGPGFDGRGPVHEYSIAGCPCMVGCLWMVTDGEIDRFLLALLVAWLKCDVRAVDDRVKDRVKPTEATRQLLAAIAVARKNCKLPYLTGAAVTAYGLPIVSQALLG
uniref:separase n=1 Tax=Plectus sambesii TaxID=2011161 RepID=A0A914XB92_9BILA